MFFLNGFNGFNRMKKHLLLSAENYSTELANINIYYHNSTPVKTKNKTIKIFPFFNKTFYTNHLSITHISQNIFHKTKEALLYICKTQS